MNFQITDTKTNVIAVRIEASDISGAKRTAIKIGLVGMFDDWADSDSGYVCGNYLLEKCEA